MNLTAVISVYVIIFLVFIIVLCFLYKIATDKKQFEEVERIYKRVISDNNKVISDLKKLNRRYEMELMFRETEIESLKLQLKDEEE